MGARYFEDCTEAERGANGPRNGVMEYALDPRAAERLWDVSMELLAAADVGVATR